MRVNHLLLFMAGETRTNSQLSCTRNNMKVNGQTRARVATLINCHPRLTGAPADSVPHKKLFRQTLSAGGLCLPEPALPTVIS